MSVPKLKNAVEDCDLSGVTIFTTGNCIYCDAAKAVIERAGLEYREVPIALYPELWKAVCHKYKWKGAPLVLMDDKPVGGFPELSILLGRKDVNDRAERSMEL